MIEKDLSYILKLKSNEAIRLGKETTDIDVVLTLSKHPDPIVRKKALVEMCPCRVKADLDKFWERVFEMINDESNIVRAQVNFLSFNSAENLVLFYKRYCIHFVMDHPSI